MSDTYIIRSGFFWLSGGAIIQNIFKLLVTAALSRLLSADAFGVMTIAAVIIGLAELLTQISLGKSMVQIENLTESHISVAFSFSILSGVALLLMFVFAVNPLVSAYYKYDGLTDILNVLAFLFPIRSFSQISFSLLQRDKAFKKLAGLDALSYVLGYGIVAIFLAWYGYGVWSLVYGSLVVGLSYSILLYVQAKFKMRFSFNLKVFKSMFDFGLKYSAIKIVNYGALKSDYVVIGRVLGAAQLGIYNRAYALMDAVNGILGKVLYTLLFPFFAQDKGNDSFDRTLILKLLGVMFNVVLPLSILTSIYAEEVVYVILGSRWESAIILFRIISVSMIARVGYKLVSSFLLSTDSINGNLRIQTAYFCLVVIGTYVGSTVGGLLGSAIAVSLVLFIIFAAFITKLTQKDKFITYASIIFSAKRGFYLSLLFGLTNVALKYLLSVLNSPAVVVYCSIIFLNLLLISVIIFKLQEVFLEPPLRSMISRIKWNK